MLSDANMLLLLFIVNTSLANWGSKALDFTRFKMSLQDDKIDSNGLC